MEKNGLSGQTKLPEGYKKALQRAATLCSRKEMCSGQIRQKLKEWDIPVAWTDRILTHLTEQKFVDDNRFASLFVREKFRLNRWGRVKMMHVLRQYGLDEGIIQNALEEIDEEAYYQTCYELVKIKSGTLKEKNQFSRKGKLLRYATGKGFETDLVYQILNREDLG